jgi:hypothetical protein
LTKRYTLVTLESIGTKQGLLYLLVRGLLPGLAFFVSHETGLISGTLWQALAIGLGGEGLLRAGIYTGRKDNTQVFRGTYQLLVRLQDFMLTTIDGPMAIRRRELVDSYVGTISCSDLCERILTNLGAWPIPEARKVLEKAVNEFKKKAALLQEDGCPRKVAYVVLDHVGKAGLKVMLS